MSRSVYVPSFIETVRNGGKEAKNEKFTDDDGDPLSLPETQYAKHYFLALHSAAMIQHTCLQFVIFLHANNSVHGNKFVGYKFISSSFVWKLQYVISRVSQCDILRGRKMKV